LRREFGVAPKHAQFMACLTFFCPPGKLGIPYHVISHLYLVELPAGAKMQVNKENSEARWFSSINPRWPKMTREMLEAVGFRVMR
jgi:ADP-ribose pyrophosphatase YjhB (NUDIX family)